MPTRKLPQPEPAAETGNASRLEALTDNVPRESWQICDIHQGIHEADADEFATDDEVKAVFAKYGS